MSALPAECVLEADLFIIGSGPAGLTIAGELAGSGIRTILVESGGLKPDPAVEALGQYESVGESRVMDPWLVRNRLLGGTSYTWAGRCAPFDAIDYAVRAWVPNSGWPIDSSDLKPFLARSAAVLGLTPVFDEVSLPGARSGPVDPDLAHCLWQYSQDEQRPRDFMRFGPAFMRRTADNIRVLLQTTATELLTNAAGNRIEGVVVKSLDGRRATIRARAGVLCAGGIENARLLLLSRSASPNGLGNAYDIVGRYLMDHPRCDIGDFAPTDSRLLLKDYGLFRPPNISNTYLRGLTLNPATQAREQLLNCAAWLTQDRAPDDPWTAAKQIMLSQRVRRQDAWSIVSQPVTILKGLDDWLRKRQGLPHKLRRLVLDVIVEQSPTPDSRVVLSDKRDALNQPIARIDWRISEQEKRTALYLFGAISREFDRRGFPKPRPVDWIRAHDFSAATFRDVAHPTGTTRMGSDLRTSIVDRNAKVHEVNGLYVAGTSIFPTSGHANPTLAIVALALRLADHLKAIEFGASAPSATIVMNPTA